MSNIAIIDVETTGIDVTNLKVIEFCYLITETESFRPLFVCNALLKDCTPTVLSKEIEDLTHIKETLLEEFGLSREDIYRDFLKRVFDMDVKYLVAHNGNQFDRRILERDMPQLKKSDRVWIDTMYDLPEEAFASKRLTYMAADLGIINPYPHSAIGDVTTLCKILSKFSFDKVLERAASPLVTVRINTQYDDREEAKKRGFRWQEIDGDLYPKSWVKRIKEIDFEKEERKASPFNLQRY